MLTTGDIKIAYPLTWPSITSTGSTIGGAPNSGSLVQSYNTGIFPTGSSSIPGGTTYVRYSKLFFTHSGMPGSNHTIQDPFIYITNETVDNQISLAPDPYFLSTDSAQTGVSSGRAVIPNGLNSGHFSGYSIDSPLRISNLPRGSFSFVSGSAIGVWVKQSIQPGLSSSATNSFQLVLKGDIV